MIKKIVIACLLITSLYAQTATAPAVGDGSESNPYQIASLENLYWISDNWVYWDKHYIQTSNINASECARWAYTNEYSGWKPIGTNAFPFTGTYDGQYYKIDSLSIFNGGYSNLINQGLFGVVRNAEISNLGLTNSYIFIPYGEKIGSLSGYCDSSTIKKCYCVGAVNGTEYVGGLVGYLSNSTVNECYVKNGTYRGIVSEYTAGGISGYSVNSDINNCYNNMYVSGGTPGSSPITTWSGYFEEVDTNVNINKCYSKQPSMAFSYYGLPESDNFCGWPVPYYDWKPLRFTESLRQAEQMKAAQIYLDVGWDFVNETESGTEDIWDIDTSGVINGGYPYLSWEDGVSSNFTSIKDIAEPLIFKLDQNYPNPFNPTTTIGFDVYENSYVKLDIYNISGQKVETLVDGYHQAGHYKIKWDASKYSSGIYIYRLEYLDKHISRKMLLIK